MRKIVEDIIKGHRLTANDTIQLIETHPLDELQNAANTLRTHFHKNHFDSCSIVNAQSGRCPEDCKWCAQSKFFSTNIDAYPLIHTKTALHHAQINRAAGIKRIALVTSGRSLTDPQIEKTANIYRQIKQNYPLSLCASMGLLTLAQLEKLQQAGVTRYHCNMETAPSLFHTLCSTHTQDEKLETIRHAQSLGMSICSGGIIGMGETMEQRVELAVYLRDTVGADSVPINILSPIAGTPLENTAPLSDDEILRSLAMFTLVLPDRPIRLAGGRAQIKHLTRSSLRGGVSGAIMGDMLTTLGASVEQDKRLLEELDLEM